VSKLAKQGTQVVILYRELTWALPLKVSGDLGMTVLHVNLLYYRCKVFRNTMFEIRMPFSEPSNTATQFTTSSAETTKQSFPSLNKLADGRNFKYHDVHVTAAQRIAEAVAKHNVSRFIHLSSYNANPNSESKFYATKVLYPLDIR
jgi:NADH dehydrogenase (ubiquinone) 1 alpha subcomplex subunit 9